MRPSPMGANCLNDDPESIAESNEWCNRYGIDTISAGSIIGFAIEAYERIITKKTPAGLNSAERPPFSRLPAKNGRKI